jgi:hypothetical protein
MKKIAIASPLFADWTEQYVRLYLADTRPGAPLVLTVNGRPVPFQYTGMTTPAGAEILLKLGLAAGERKELVFEEQTVEGGRWGVDGRGADLRRTELSLVKGATIGTPLCTLTVPPVPLPKAGYRPQPDVVGRASCPSTLETGGTPVPRPGRCDASASHFMTERSDTQHMTRSVLGELPVLTRPF